MNFRSQRRERDSNPRRCYPQRFSRPPQSTTLPSLQVLDLSRLPQKRCKDKDNNWCIQIFCKVFLLFRCFLLFSVLFVMCCIAVGRFIELRPPGCSAFLRCFFIVLFVVENVVFPLGFFRCFLYFCFSLYRPNEPKVCAAQHERCEADAHGDCRSDISLSISILIN